METAPGPPATPAGSGNGDSLAALRQLSNGELIARVGELAGCERGAAAALVVHLGEMEVRDLHLGAGFGSLFSYCREALGFSEADAYTRVEVARAVRRCPAIVGMLDEGAVNLTSVRILAPYLTPENHCEVLEAARGKRKAQVEEIVARLSPVPDVPPSLRKLPPPRAGLPVALAPVEAPAMVTFSRPFLSPPLARASGEVTPLSPERYRLQVTIGGETLERLRLARDMLRHAIPSGDHSAILDRALAVLLADLARKKFAATAKPQPPRGTAPGSRHIPAEVKRTVWLRDLGRCAFRATAGRRCAERAFLEFHHLRPYAEGGDATVANMELRCRRHNDYESRHHFGQGRIEATEAAREP
jgi:hypothetical protein